MLSLRVALPLALLTLAIPCLPALADGTPPAAVTVTITDTGFSPAAVGLQPGGSITWLNQSGHVHTATSIGGAILPFNTGGVQPGQVLVLLDGLLRPVRKQRDRRQALPGRDVVRLGPEDVAVILGRLLGAGELLQAIPGGEDHGG